MPKLNTIFQTQTLINLCETDTIFQTQT